MSARTAHRLHFGNINASNVKAHAEANAREYPTAEAGPRVNDWAIVVRFGVKPWTFRRRQSDGWPGLGGKAIPAERQYSPEIGRWEYTYAEADVRAAVQGEGRFPVKADGGQWIDFATWRNAKGEWLTLEGVMKNFPDLPDSSIKRYANKELARCRYLTNARGEPRHLKFELVRPAIARRAERIRVYFRPDIEEIDAARKKPAHDTVMHNGQKRFVSGTFHTNAAGKPCLTEMQALNRRGVDGDFLGYWANRPSRIRPGQKALRSERIPNPNPQKGSPGTIFVFVEEDINAILDGKESANPGTGKGANADRFRAARRIAAVKAVETILADGPARMADVIARAKRDHGVSRKDARRAFKALRGIAEPRRLARGQYIEWRLPQSANGKPADAPRPEPAAQTTAEPAPTPNGRQKAGRRPSAATMNKYRVCHELYERVERGEMKMATALREAAKILGTAAPKEKSHLRGYAKRYRNSSISGGAQN